MQSQRTESPAEAVRNASFGRHHSEQGFWRKVTRLPRSASGEILERALLLWSILVDRGTPAWARVAIVACLGYFVAPMDAVPDFVPVVGLADDLSAMVLLLARLEHLATEKARERAKDKVAHLRGEAKAI